MYFSLILKKIQKNKQKTIFYPHACLAPVSNIEVWPVLEEEDKLVSIRVHGLQLPQTCYGVLHVMETHTNRRIYRVTVVLSVARKSLFEFVARMAIICC